MIEERQLDELVDLAIGLRPHGAQHWDPVGIKAALRKVQHLSLGEVMVVVAAAAGDRNLKTPGALGNPDAPIWRQAAEQAAAPVTPVSARVSSGALCSVCSQPEPRCRALWADDHEYLSNDALRAEVDAQDPMERAWRIADLKAMVGTFGKMPED